MIFTVKPARESGHNYSDAYSDYNRTKDAGDSYTKPKTAEENWKVALYDFTQNTTFHGIKYVFEVNRTCIQR